MKDFLADIMMKSENPDLFEYILYKKLHGKKSTVKKEEGVPPLTFTSSGFPLNSYEIYGNLVNGEGVGERTENICKLGTTTTFRGITFTVENDGTVAVSGRITSGNESISARVSVYIYGDGDYIFSGCPEGGSNDTYYAYMWDYTAGERCKRWDGTTSVYNEIGLGQQVKIISGHEVGYCISVKAGVTYENLVFKPMIRLRDTTADFEPYGYKIPISCAGDTTTIYIGENPLRKALDDSVFDELSSEGIIIRRVDDEGTPLVEPITETVTCPVIDTDEGSNTFDVDTTVTPSKVILYHT